jgi:hypothetical protein
LGEIEGLRPAGTFMGVPPATAVKRGQAVILGLPIDRHASDADRLPPGTGGDP